jgi:hypothetical protein
MSWSLFRHTAAGSVDAGLSVTTPPISTIGVDLIILAASYYGFASSPGTFSDNQGGSNTYQLRTAYFDGVLSGVQIAYCDTVLAQSASHTFSLNSAGTYMSLMVLAVAGAASSPYDTENGSAPGTSGTTIQPGSITPGLPGELLVTVLNVNGDEVGGNAPSIGNGFTITDTVDYSAGNHFLGSLAYLVQGSAAAINPTWTYGVSHERAAAIAAFEVFPTSRRFLLMSA